MGDLGAPLGEGPCLDAYQQNRVVADPDLADPVTRRSLASPASTRSGRAGGVRLARVGAGTSGGAPACPRSSLLR